MSWKTEVGRPKTEAKKFAQGIGQRAGSDRLTVIVKNQPETRNLINSIQGRKSEDRSLQGAEKKVNGNQ